eukprot:CAMPEP_0204902852 /NCGR_PEP_ID=MMETSP1397-20131031/3921_1 /ASSEMBLY_ACC=CAM_ASM_000891 /TAXON_ID=49980 /ORGANISM="Climacostomum Climacostomum virens, Strain Stock W-24" /LENGTH=1040 /DNA_ID=CAMNT_0052071421 /DNA_START=20 /DNA_END=3139 /DNA_ORIENTATION=-
MTTLSVQYAPPNLTEMSNVSLNSLKDRDIRRRYADSLSPQSFAFDHVYGPEITTQEIHNEICRPIVQSVLDGYNGAIFMYGQTTSGKTYTMLGTPDLPGVLPCSVRDIFTAITTDTQFEYNVWASYLEIYNEQINDLLSPGSTNLKIKEDPKQGVRIQGLKQQQVWTFDQVIILMNYGEEHRCYRETSIHEHSSRSHTIFKLFLESTRRVRPQGDGRLRFSSLNLVDLAGSERLNEFEVRQPEQLGETGHINKSLFILANVVNKLAEGKRQYIPYRDSKLTRILSDALGGNSLAAIICTVSPAGMNFHQTLSTLRFAMRAKTVHNEPEVNEILDDAAKLNALKLEVLRLKEELQQGHKSSEQLASINSDLKRNLQLSKQELLAVQQELQQTKVSRDRLQETVQHLKQRVEVEGDTFSGHRTELTDKYQTLLDRLQEERSLRTQLEKELESYRRGVKGSYSVDQQAYRGASKLASQPDLSPSVSSSIEVKTKASQDQLRTSKDRQTTAAEYGGQVVAANYRRGYESSPPMEPPSEQRKEVRVSGTRSMPQHIDRKQVFSGIDLDFSRIIEEYLKTGSSSPDFAEVIVSRLKDHHEELLSRVDFRFDEARAQLEAVYRQKVSSPEQEATTITALTSQHNEKLKLLRNQYEDILQDLEDSYMSALKDFEDHISTQSKAYSLPSGSGFLWGSGKDGRCGSGNEENQKRPHKIFAESGVKLMALVCGYHHSAAISDRGVLFTWGRGIFGQLGHDNNESYTVPTPVASLSEHKILQVACGWQHTIALTTTGRVFSWGYGDDGQLGHGDANDYLSPREISSINHITVTFIACGHSHSGAISEGRLYMWGCNPDARLFTETATTQLTPTPVSLPGRVMNASLGVSHSAAVLEDGHLYTAGMGTDGQLGKAVDGFVPRCEVEDFGHKRRAVSVSCGDSFTLVLDEFQQVYSFGKGSHGRLGLGSDEDRSKPTMLKSLSSERVVQVSAGCRHSGAVTESGKLYMWGFNFYEQLGLQGGDRDIDRPTAIRGLSGVQSVSCGYFHTGTVISN